MIDVALTDKESVIAFILEMMTARANAWLTFARSSHSRVSGMSKLLEDRTFGTRR